jgi:hypothetical protein
MLHGCPRYFQNTNGSRPLSLFAFGTLRMNDKSDCVLCRDNG